MAEDDGAARNLAWADALAAGLSAGGVVHAVISPGSRSTPLALAFARHPAIGVTVLPDERCAAFFALGLGRHEARPAVFLCTSGSAVANAFPALLEAEADGVPLIVISADRPAELQQTGANQTMDQTALFGRHVRHAVSLPAPPDGDTKLPRSAGLRAAEHARWPQPGPIHVNVCLREPLVPEELPATPAPSLPVTSRRPTIMPEPDAVAWLTDLLAGGPGLIVCGRGHHGREFPQALTSLARRLGAPVCADPLSGLRWGPHDRSVVMTAYDLFLRGTPADRPPSWILQFGATPVSASLERYLAGSGCPRVLVATGGDWQDPSRLAGRRILADAVALSETLASRVAETVDGDWLAAWQRSDARGRTLGEETPLRPPEADVVAALEAGLAPGALLFVGNSMPIRALDVFARGRSAPLPVYGNRGLSGIDGNVSTALGLGRAAGARPTALLGDLTLYHDMNGLLATRDVPGDFVVIDNGGGGIFELLPQAGLPDFERLWLTPTGLEPERVASVYDLDYAFIDEPRDLGSALSGAGRARLIHVKIDRGTSTRRFRRLFAAATDLRGND